MKKKIQLELDKIERSIARIENEDRFCYIKPEWQLLNAQRQIVAKILLMFPQKKIS